MQACGPSRLCGPSPVSQLTPLPASRSFRKAVAGRRGPGGQQPQRQRHHLRLAGLRRRQHGATSWRGQTGNQSAKTYRIQVDNEPSFATPDRHRDRRPDDVHGVRPALPRRHVLLAGAGTRRREQRADLVSAVQSFTKSSPPVAPSSPVGGVQVPGTTPFRWSAQPFAASYTVEVYKNNDQTFSSCQPGLQRHGQDDRVRAVVARSRPPARRTCGACVATTRPATRARGRRRSRSSRPALAPSLLSPAAGIWLKNAGALFEWTEVPGAASYKLNITGTKAQQRDHGGHGVRAQRPGHRQLRLERDGVRRRRQPARRPARPASTRSTPRRRSSRSSRPTSTS